jgi:hypothetical protein
MSERTMKRHRTHWVLWPVVALWRLLAGIVTLTGRFVAIVIGMVLIFAGLLVSLTIVGAIVGIPLALVGVLLVVRGLA